MKNSADYNKFLQGLTAGSFVIGLGKLIIIY